MNSMNAPPSSQWHPAPSPSHLPSLKADQGSAADTHLSAVPSSPETQSERSHWGWGAHRAEKRRIKEEAQEIKAAMDKAWAEKKREIASTQASANDKVY